MITPAATKTDAAIANLMFRGCAVDAMRRMDVRIRDTQKTVMTLADALRNMVWTRTEYEEVEQELVPSRSVLLEDLHVYSRTYHE